MPPTLGSHARTSPGWGGEGTGNLVMTVHVREVLV